MNGTYMGATDYSRLVTTAKPEGMAWYDLFRGSDVEYDGMISVFDISKGPGRGDLLPKEGWALTADVKKNVTSYVLYRNGMALRILVCTRVIDPSCGKRYYVNNVMIGGEFKATRFTPRRPKIQHLTRG